MSPTEQIDAALLAGVRAVRQAATAVVEAPGRSGVGAAVAGSSHAVAVGACAHMPAAVCTGTPRMLFVGRLFLLA